MSERLGYYKGDPIILIDEIDAVHTHIYDCPLCGRHHRHGAADLAYHQLSHRNAHCKGGGGYWLVANNETDGFGPD